MVIAGERCVGDCSCLVDCGVGPSMRHVTVVSCLLTRGARPSVSRVCLTLYGSVPALSGAAICGALGLFIRRKTTLVLAVSRGGTYFSNSASLRTRFLYGGYNGVFSLPCDGRIGGMRRVSVGKFGISRVRRCCGNVYPTYSGRSWREDWGK